jgi:serine/threonine-protein kinase
MKRRAPGWAGARRVAVGGMGEIWRATAADGTPVAIKRLLPALADRPDFVSAFLEEARLLALLDHPNVLRVLDVGADEEPWLAVEWVDGVDLARVVHALRARGWTAPLGLVALVARDLLAALAHVHAARDEAGRPLGLVHRDVSPHNLILRPDGACTLIDFGVARCDEPRTAARFPGKVAYQAPEQIEGRSLDHRADLFAAGTLLYELAAGRHPFLGGCEGATLRATALARPPPPSSLRRDLPERFSGVLMRALSARPENRFPGAREFAVAAAAALPPPLGPEEVAALLARLFPGGFPHDALAALDLERPDAGGDMTTVDEGAAPLGRLRLVRAEALAVPGERPEVEILFGPVDEPARAVEPAPAEVPPVVSPSPPPEPARAARRPGHAPALRPRPETRPPRPPVLYPTPAPGPPLHAAEGDGGAGVR